MNWSTTRLKHTSTVAERRNKGDSMTPSTNASRRDMICYFCFCTSSHHHHSFYTTVLTTYSSISDMWHALPTHRVHQSRPSIMLLDAITHSSWREKIEVSEGDVIDVTCYIDYCYLRAELTFFLSNRLFTLPNTTLSRLSAVSICPSSPVHGTVSTISRMS